MTTLDTLEFQRQLRDLMLEVLPVSGAFAGRTAFDVTAQIAQTYELPFPYAPRHDGIEHVRVALVCLRRRRRRGRWQPLALDEQTRNFLDQQQPLILASIRALGRLPELTHDEHDDELTRILAPGRDAADAAEEFNAYITQHIDPTEAQHG